jgi:hypothetical protein
MRHATILLPLYEKGDAPSNERGSIVTKAAASLILNKLRCAEKPSVYFLSSIEPGAHLSDAGAPHFTRSEMIVCGRIPNLRLLFKFLT